MILAQTKVVDITAKITVYTLIKFVEKETLRVRNQNSLRWDKRLSHSFEWLSVSLSLKDYQIVHTD